MDQTSNCNCSVYGGEGPVDQTSNCNCSPQMIISQSDKNYIHGSSYTLMPLVLTGSQKLAY